MKINGLTCLLCDSPLELIQMINGGTNIKCTNCGHETRPRYISDSSKNQQSKIYSKFANKSIEIEYSRKKSISGTFNKINLKDKKIG